jgi:ParB-like chromosome segregation protein Spo0J
MVVMVEYRKISELKLHGNNPRLIKDDKFKKLVKSIKDFPEMLEKRPLVVDEDGIILGGNMRFRSCLELKMKEVPVIVAKGWTDEQKNEFVIKDNVSSGEFDFDVLANEWDVSELEEWGLFIPIFGDEIKVKKETKKIEPYKKTHILLSFPPEKIDDIKKELENIINLDYIEYEQSSN